MHYTSIVLRPLQDTRFNYVLVYYIVCCVDSTNLFVSQAVYDVIFVYRGSFLSQWLRRLRRVSAASRLLGLWVRGGMDVCCLWVLCVLS